MDMTANAYPYRQFPTIAVTGHDGDADRGFGAIRDRIAGLCRGRDKTVLVVECYPGVDQRELLEGLAPLGLAAAVHSDDLALSPGQIDDAIDRELTDDPVFGIMTT